MKAIGQLKKTPNTQCANFGSDASYRLTAGTLKWALSLGSYNGGVVLGQTSGGQWTFNRVITISNQNWSPYDPHVTNYNLFDTIAHEEAHAVLQAPDPGDYNPAYVLTGYQWGQVCVNSFVGAYGGFAYQK
jgi:hypothetical protein